MSEGSAWGPRRNEVLEHIREQFGVRERQRLQDQVYQKTKYRDGLQDEIERRIYGEVSTNHLITILVGGGRARGHATAHSQRPLRDGD